MATRARKNTGKSATAKSKVATKRILPARKIEPPAFGDPRPASTPRPRDAVQEAFTALHVALHERADAVTGVRVETNVLRDLRMAAEIVEALSRMLATKGAPHRPRPKAAVAAGPSLSLNKPYEWAMLVTRGAVDTRVAALERLRGRVEAIVVGCAVHGIDTSAIVDMHAHEATVRAVAGAIADEMVVSFLADTPLTALIPLRDSVEDRDVILRAVLSKPPKKWTDVEALITSVLVALGFPNRSAHDLWSYRAKAQTRSAK